MPNKTISVASLLSLSGPASRECQETGSMVRPSTRSVEQMAQDAGYQVVAAEQLRANRWLLTLTDSSEQVTLVLVQARPLVGSSDVQDLAEFVQLRRPGSAILLALGGAFSASALRTCAELGDRRMQLCTAMPSAPATRADDPYPRGVPVASR